jgi:hypothetical protein
MGVIYVYGFVPRGVDLPPDGLLGVDGALVETVDGPGFSAVVSRVDGAAFTGPALERNCEDVDWMARLGLSHEEVVAWFVDHATIVPATLLTLFTTDEGLASAMEGDADRVRGALDEFAELREWDLRIGHDPALLMEHLGEVSPDVARLDREIEEASPGKRFLLEKKRRDLARTEGRGVARRLAREIVDGLRPLAREVVVLDAPGAGEPATLAAALLVPRDREGEVSERVRSEQARLGPVGVTVQYTGPWAPYRFLGRHGS